LSKISKLHQKEDYQITFDLIVFIEKIENFYEKKDKLYLKEKIIRG